MYRVALGKSNKRNIKNSSLLELHFQFTGFCPYFLDITILISLLFQPLSNMAINVFILKKSIDISLLYTLTYFHSVSL